MRLRIAIVAICLLALAVSASAVEETVLREGTYASLGWTKTVKVGPEPGGSVTFQARADTQPSFQEGVQCSPKKSASNNLAWAGISAPLFEGRLLSTITTLKIRTAGFEGDGTEWEPPSVYLQVSKDGLNQRNLRFLPYASYGRGTAKTFYEYDMLGPDAKWFCMIDASINTWAQVLSKWPNIQFDSTVTSPLPSGQTFNVFNGCALNEELKYGSSARGSVDWVEIGFDNGDHYIFKFRTLGTFFTANRSAYDPIMSKVGWNATYVMFGRVISVPSPDYFIIDDGSGSTIKVACVGHPAYEGAYVRCRGAVNTSTPRTLNSTPDDVQFVY